MSDQPIKCSRCNVAAQVSVEDGNPKNVVCPQCGVSESYETVRESLRRQMAAHAHEKISKPLKDLARSNKNFSYTPGNVRAPNSNFRVDL